MIHQLPLVVKLPLQTPALPRFAKEDLRRFCPEARDIVGFGARRPPVLGSGFWDPGLTTKGGER